MGIIGWIILGLVAGTIAKIVLPGRDPGGIVGTVFTGVAGAFLGGWFSTQFLHRPVQHTFFDARNWGAAIIGSIVLLILFRVFSGNKTRR